MYGRPLLAEFLLQKMKEYKKEQRKHPDWASLRQLLSKEGLQLEEGVSPENQVQELAVQLPIDCETSLLHLSPEQRQEYCLESFLDENRPE